MRRYLPVFIVFLLVAGNIWAQESSEKEIANKARIMVTIINNTEWPNQSGTGEDTFTISVIGQPKFIEKLKQLASQELKATKNITVRSISIDDDFSESNVVFIADGDLSLLAKVLKKVENQPILTASDVAGFARYGVIAELEPAKDGSGNVEYLINKMVLRKSGLKMSEDIVNKAHKTFGK